MTALFNYFVYGSWWVALCATSMGLLSWFELTGDWWNLPLAVFIVGCTLVVYNLNMLSGLDELREIGTDSERHHWCLEHEALMKFTLVIGLILAGSSVWFLNPVIWLFMIPVSVLALVYTVPVLKKHKQGIRLREIGLWKIFLIAIVWSGMTVILPAVQLDGLQQFTNLKSWWLAIERGFFILAITIPFDIRDLVNDAKKGIRTIPSSIGSFRAILLSLLLLAMFLYLVWWRLGLGPLFHGYLISTLITMLGVSYANPERNDMYTSFWVEGTIISLMLGVYLCDF